MYFFLEKIQYTICKITGKRTFDPLVEIKDFFYNHGKIAYKIATHSFRSTSSSRKPFPRTAGPPAASFPQSDRATPFLYVQ